MSSDTNSGNVLDELSENLAAAVEAAQPWIVRVSGRRRFGATGLIWSSDGMIVTADHVIDRSDNVKVGMPDGREVPATLVARDPATDLALLNVDASGLSPAEFVSEPVKVGHLVLALGRPRGDHTSASLGVVSTVEGSWRSWRGGSIEGVVRSDVTLYPGFSGGPLVSATSKVIGLNTSMLARGLAVTIPKPVIDRVVKALSSGQGTGRGYLGIATQPVRLPEGLRSSLGLEQQTALLIVSVESGSPAEHAGFLLGDTLIEFAGREMSEITVLQDSLGPGSAGSQQSARLIRGGQLTELNITIGER